MPLKPCRECGKEVSTEATTCPNCGTPDPTRSDPPPAEKKRGGWAIGCAGFVLFLIIVGVLTSESGGSGSVDRAPQTVPDLRAGARVTSTQIHVTNNDSFAWTDCKVELNTGIVRGGYSTNVARIGVGETVTGGLMTFTKSGGERFNPMTHAVENVYVVCQTPRGRASWMGTFD